MSTCIHLFKKRPITALSAVSWFSRTRPLSLGSWGVTTETEVDEWTVSSVRRATELFEPFLMAFFTATS